MATRFTEIRTGHYDESSNFYTIDAEGKVVAVVNGTTGDVWFIDNTCRNDEGILDSIMEVKARIVNKKILCLEKAKWMLEGMLMNFDFYEINELKFNECVAKIHKKYIVYGFDEEGINEKGVAWYEDIKEEYI